MVKTSDIFKIPFCNIYSVSCS